MKLWHVHFHGNRPSIIVWGKTESQVKRDMRDMFGHDKIDDVDPISRNDAEEEYGDDYDELANMWQRQQSESVLTGHNPFYLRKP